MPILDLVSYAVAIVGPAWFLKYSILFKFFFAIITLLIFYVSEGIYKFSGKRDVRHFGLGFFFLSLSFFITALSEMGYIYGMFDIFRYPILLANFFYFSHIFFHLVGLIVIALVSLKVRSKKIAMLMFSFILLFILFSYQYYIKFHLVAFILLIFITLQYFWNLERKRKLNSAFVFVSFYFLTIAEVAHFSTLYLFPSIYLVAHMFQFFGYGLLLVMLLRVMNNG